MQTDQTNGKAYPCSGLEILFLKGHRNNSLAEGLTSMRTILICNWNIANGTIAKSTGHPENWCGRYGLFFRNAGLRMKKKNSCPSQAILGLTFEYSVSM